MPKPKKIIIVGGARPNFMKIAPIIRALTLQAKQKVIWRTVHTGQHYDWNMSQSFFEDLEIPKPDFFLNAGSGSHAEQTAKIMVGFERVAILEKPDIVLVVGDVNSTLACSIVAKKLMIKVGHVEAGLRSFDWTMPEEINRIVTDSIADYLFVTEKNGIENLRKEGKPKSRIYFVGHVMIDNLYHQLRLLENENPTEFETYNLKRQTGRYVFLTLHRPSNVDSKKSLKEIAAALNEIAKQFPIFFPVHPRTQKMIDIFGIRLNRHIIRLNPLGFKESLFLWKDAEIVMTDSGGLQEETTALNVPCLTIRKNTERPITITMGTNTLAGVTKREILDSFKSIRSGQKRRHKIPPLWDGKAAERIVDILLHDNGP